ncbi:MAG: hypothetical protein AAB804_03030 [Patescibacteria group bacterium]
MKHIAAHLKRPVHDIRATERGELMTYFCEKLNRARLRDGLGPVTMGRMGKLLQEIPTKDLYYLKRVCDDAGNFSKKFWWEINPKKHQKDGS